MNDENSKQLFRYAVLEWQRKHGIRDDDPSLAMLDLLEIYFRHRPVNGSIGQPPTYAEFRETLEYTERLTKQLGKQASDLVQEVRSVPKLRDELANGKTTAIATVAICAFVAGLLVGRFIL